MGREDRGACCWALRAELYDIPKHIHHKRTTSYGSHCLGFTRVWSSRTALDWFQSTYIRNLVSLRDLLHRQPLINTSNFHALLARCQKRMYLRRGVE
jgi:hypothetical protein